MAKKTTRKSATKKPTAKKSAKKATAKKPTTRKKPTAKKTAAKKPTAKKTASKKTTPKKTTANKTAKKTTAKKPVKKKATAKKSVAKKTTAKKTAPKKTAPKKTAAKKTTAKKTPAARATTRPSASPSSKRATKPSTARREVTPPRPPGRKVRPAKFDKGQLKAIKEKLQQERADLEKQLTEVEEESFTGTQSELTGDVGLNDDFADAGSATFDRENALSIRNNIRDLIDQISRAIVRIDEGNYGTCERCGKPIDAARLKALPHALLCMDCKRREERAR